MSGLLEASICPDPGHSYTLMIRMGKISGIRLLESSPRNGEHDDSENKDLGQPIELVDIAIGYSNEFQPWPGSNRYHYVMWIEWEDKVAYRKGLGEVSKEAWEAQDKELIHLMLG